MHRYMLLASLKRVETSSDVRLTLGVEQGLRLVGHRHGRGQDVDFDCRGEWGAWSECSAPCGGGTRERVYIVRIAAVAGGRQCAANDGDIERDSPADCEAPCPVNCAGGWGDWSVCSRNCGGGVRHRSYEIDVPAAGGGDQSTCLFADAAHAEGGCNTEPCGEAVECIGSWGTWGACDASCGGGVQRRTYTIEWHAAIFAPAAKVGGTVMFARTVYGAPPLALEATRERDTRP